MSLKLRLMNDPILREPTLPVNQEDMEFILSSVPEMTKIMNYEVGQALAANQVGISKRFFIIKIGDSVKLMVNPEILAMGETISFEEGCLSIPGTSAQTQRAKSVKLKFRDENFNEYEEEFTGITAIAIQHEVDHLDGKLYIDQLPSMRRLLVVDKHRKFLKMRSRRG